MGRELSKISDSLLETPSSSSRTPPTASPEVDQSVAIQLPCTEEGEGFLPGGVLSGKVGTGMCGPDRVLFRPLRFSNGPFFI